MKKILAIVLLCALLFSISIVPSFATDGPVDILSSEEMDVINSEFPREIQYIETEKSIDLSSISEAEWEVVKNTVAPQLNNPNYDFCGLMSAFTRALAQKKAESSNKARWSQTIIYRDDPVRYYGPIKGRIVTKVPAATTYTGSYEVSVESGYEKDGYTIGLAFSLGGSCSYSGPNTSDVLPNGMRTTHHVAIGVLYGEIYYKEYDLVTAFNTTRVSYYYIYPDTAITTPYTIPAHISIPTYAQSAVTYEVIPFNDEPELNAEIIANPEVFVLP